MWRELWKEHRKGVLFAAGMLFFLTAGLVTRLLPLQKENQEETPFVQFSPPPQPFAEEPAARPPQASAVPSKGGTETKSAVNVLPVSASEADTAADAENSKNEWFVYVTGSVRNPGVYKLPAGSRLFHLVEAAGGLNGFADPVAVNMAAPLEDGVHIHVPRKSERSPENPAVIAEPSVTTPRRARSASSAKGLVDVNRASREELTSLKGVGPALAKNIIEYRQKNGPFRSIEDLLRVKGIGAKKLEGFRDSLTLGP
ncbi:MAG: ComEA family DNA-binding protein [Synergistaceae bacterium]|jgi:competence protein ComEA|nr:ComEA family DNA-binding protein [Synergistaceae bacterium]